MRETKCTFGKPVYFSGVHIKQLLQKSAMLYFVLVCLEFMRQGIADGPSRVWRRVQITSTVALRVVKGDEKGTQWRGI
jgi:hypothetical protein